MARISLIAGLCMAALFLPVASAGAANTDPDWPCIQRKVPQLSFGQVWNGTDLPAAAKDWAKDAGVSALVEKVSARRLPLDDARKEIRDFAAALSADQLEPRMAMLVQGLFDRMSAERSHVMAGIARYAHKQLEIAAQLRKEGSELDALRDKPDADEDVIARRTDQLTFATRIFDERVQSLTYVCDVPTIIEKRLYQLNKTVSDTMAGKK